MMKLTEALFTFIILLIFCGLAACFQTGDEERPGMSVNSELINSKVWKITSFEDDGQDRSTLFKNVYLEFRPNFVFKITKECAVIEGEWILASGNTLLVIRVPDSQEPMSQLEDEWIITKLTDTEMHIIEQDDKGDEEFHFQVAPLQSLSCQSCDNITSILVDSVWSITMLAAGANDVTSETKGAYLDFQEDGLVILHIDEEELVAFWVITDNCQSLEIKWKDNQMLPKQYLRLEDTWSIQETDLQLIVFENEETDANLQIVKGRIPECPDLLSDMLNTSWFIDYMAINDDDLSGHFVGTGLTFLENDQLATEVVVGPAVLGGWMISGACDRLDIEIQSGQLKVLSRQWIITDIENEKITMVYEEGTLRMELHLKKGKPVRTDHCVELIEYIVQDKWSVKAYSEDDQSDDTRFKGYYFRFKENGHLNTWNSDQQVTGKWYPINSCRSLVIEIDKNSIMEPLAGEWEIEQYRDNSITLVYEVMGKTRTLELVRN